MSVSGHETRCEILIKTELTNELQLVKPHLSSDWLNQVWSLRLARQFELSVLQY